jgi:hypothetical protein
MSKVRNAVRWTIVRNSDASQVEGLEILVLPDGKVLVDDGELTFTGDLLALEALAKLHRGVAHPVESPNGGVTSVELVLEGPPPVLGDDLPVEPEPIQEPATTVVPPDEPIAEVDVPSIEQKSVNDEGQGVVPVIQPETSSVSPEPDIPVGSEIEIDPVLRHEPISDDPHVQHNLDMWLDSTSGIVIQGGGGGDGTADAVTNPYHADPGGGIDMKPVRDYLNKDNPTWYHCHRARTGQGGNLVNMVLHRDLGYCIVGMPRWAGTTICGRLRPDVGGTGPPVPDHIAWIKYGKPFG